MATDDNLQDLYSSHSVKISPAYIYRQNYSISNNECFFYIYMAYKLILVKSRCHECKVKYKIIFGWQYIQKLFIAIN